MNYHHESLLPRVGLGIAAIAMTVITFALAVLLPAGMDSGSRETRMLAASKPTPPASMGPAAVIRIDVVAAREPVSSTAPARVAEARPQAGRLADTASPADDRVSTN